MSIPLAASQTTPRCTMSAVGCQVSSRQSIEGRHVRLGIVEVHEAKASSSHLAGSGMGLARVLTQSMYLERMFSSERPRRLWSRGALSLPRAGAFIARSGLESRSRRTELASHEYALLLFEVLTSSVAQARCSVRWTAETMLTLHCIRHLNQVDIYISADTNIHPSSKKIKEMFL